MIPKEQWETMGELVTVTQAADYLQVSKKTIYRYIEQGKVKAHKLSGVRWRIVKDSVDSYLETIANSIVSSC